MIAELLQYLFLPGARQARRLGVLHGLVALQARARRCAAAWAPHLTASREAIVAAMDHAPGNGLAVVCGSGLLLDVPLDMLAGRFGKVVLVDLYHMPAARKAARRHRNVTLLEHDLSGVLAAVAADPAARPEPAAAIPFAAEADLVVSANCLSQIPLGGLDLLAADDPPWAARLVRAHLDALGACRGAAVLVSDTVQYRLAVADGRVEATSDLLFGVHEPALADRRDWWWDLAPAPEAWPRSHVRHRVVAGRLTAGQERPEAACRDGQA